MLKKYTLDSVLLITQKISKAGVVLTPIPGTSLESMVAAADGPITDVLNSNSTNAVSLEDYSDALFTQSTTTIDNLGSTHDYSIKSAVEMTVNSLEGTIQLARGIVNPAIQSIAEKIQQELNNGADITSGMPEIEMARYEPIWTSNIFLSLVKDNVGPKAVGRPAPFFDLRSAEDIKEIIKSGSSRFDAEVSELVNALGDEYLETVYSENFTKGSGASSIKGMSFIGSNGYTSRLYVLVTWLIGRGMLRNTEEGKNSEYAKYITELVTQCANTITDILAYRDRCNSLNQLVLDWGIAGGNILVNGDLYPKWLDDGNVPEIILGASGTRETDRASDLAANSGVYLQNWKAGLAVRNATINSSKYGTFRTAFLQSFLAHLDDASQGSMMFNQKTMFRSRIKDYMSFITARSMDNLYETVKRAYCNIFYSDTMVEQIIDNINDVSSKNPDLKPSEAATLAVINIVTDFYCTMVLAKSGNPVV